MTLKPFQITLPTGGMRPVIEAKLLRESGVLVVSAVGELHLADFELLRQLADSYIAEHGGLNGLLIDGEYFSRWEDFSSKLNHIHFVRDYEARISRVAAAADDGFLTILPEVEDHFASAEVRHFNSQDRTKARRWLETGLSAI